MDAQFWINAWNEGRTNFHQSIYNQKLTTFFPLLTPKAGEKVFVPLCGKSKDMLWLHEQKLKVHGVELFQQAVEDFFTENNLSPMNKSQEKDFINYTYKDIVISCGDFFKFSETEFDYIYDRASLVALPSHMRENYAKLIKDSLKIGGKYLLVVYEYDQSKLDGPPFSIDANEVHKLYENNFTIKMMESEQPQSEGSRLSAVANLKQKTYILERIR